MIYAILDVIGFVHEEQSDSQSPLTDWKTASRCGRGNWRRCLARWSQMAQDERNQEKGQTVACRLWAVVAGVLVILCGRKTFANVLLVEWAGEWLLESGDDSHGIGQQ